MRSRERQPALEKGGADELVDRVVAADVLAQACRAPLPVEERRRVEPARRLEDGLGIAKHLRACACTSSARHRRPTGQRERALRARTASIETLPHTPQLELT